MDYALELWHRLQSPQWMADSGLPLLATLLGFVAAYLFLKRQLKSDRALRRADRRQNAALALGTSIAEVLHRFDLGPTEPFWQMSSWEDGRVLSREKFNALLSLDDTVLSELTYLINDLECAWLACTVASRRQNPRPDLALHKGDVMRVTEPYREALLAESVALRMWDGTGKFAEGALGNEFHAPLQDTRIWMAERKREYETSSTGLRLIKPIGRRLGDPS